MDIAGTAIETTGTIDARRQLVLDEPLNVVGPARVRVIILLSESADADEREWRHAACANPAFAFLDEPGENLYRPDDGSPFRDSG